MHKPSRPRTPRYWPRMKVRGARRKRAQERLRQLQQYYDGVVVTRVSPSEMWVSHAKRKVRDDVNETLAALFRQGLGTSIVKEDHGSDS